MLACRDAGNPNNNRRKAWLINIIVSISIALSTVRSAGNDAGVWYREEYAITWIKLGKMKEFNNLWNRSSNPDVYLVTQGPHRHFIWEENGHGRGCYSYELNGHAAMAGEHRDRSRASTLISGRDEYLKQSLWDRLFILQRLSRFTRRIKQGVRLGTIMEPCRVLGGSDQLELQDVDVHCDRHKHEQRGHTNQLWFYAWRATRRLLWLPQPGSVGYHLF
ncbi:hypothetical protein V1524DRAFT_439189 [Lipomyces starkeyi]